MEIVKLKRRKNLKQNLKLVEAYRKMEGLIAEKNRDKKAEMDGYQLELQLLRSNWIF